MIKNLEELNTWQNNVIAEIISKKEGIYTICLDRQHGKTRMLLQLAEALQPVQVITTGGRTIGPFEPFIGPSSILLIDEVEHIAAKPVDYSKYKLVVQTAKDPQAGSVNYEAKINLEE